MDETIDAVVEEPILGDEDETVVIPAGDGGTEDATDWEAIALKERERAENYKKAFTQKREFVRAGNTTSPDIEEDEDKPLTRKEFTELLQSTVVPLVSASKEDSILANKITDPAKRAYVKQLLESRIVRTGTSDADISSDIEAALAIADSHKKDTTITELKRVANNRPQSPSAGSSSEAPLEQKSHKWTAEQARALDAKAQALGVDPEQFKKRAWDNRKTTGTAQ